MDGPFLTSQLEIPLKNTKCLKLQTNHISANLGNACVLRAKCEYQGKVESYRRPLFFHFWTEITKGGTSLALNEHHLLTFFIRLPRQFDDVFDL